MYSTEISMNFYRLSQYWYCCMAASPETYRKKEQSYSKHRNLIFKSDKELSAAEMTE